jgi:hypothetical protein
MTFPAIPTWPDVLGALLFGCVAAALALAIGDAL